MQRPVRISIGESADEQLLPWTRQRVTCSPTYVHEECELARVSSEPKLRATYLCAVLLGRRADFWLRQRQTRARRARRRMRETRLGRSCHRDVLSAPESRRDVGTSACAEGQRRIIVKL